MHAGEHTGGLLRAFIASPLPPPATPERASAPASGSGDARPSPNTRIAALEKALAAALAAGNLTTAPSAASTTAPLLPPGQLPTPPSAPLPPAGASALAMLMPMAGTSGAMSERELWEQPGGESTTARATPRCVCAPLLGRWRSPCPARVRLARPHCVELARVLACVVGSARAHLPRPLGSVVMAPHWQPSPHSVASASF